MISFLSLATWFQAAIVVIQSKDTYLFPIWNCIRENSQKKRNNQIYISLGMSMSPNWIEVSIESTVGGSQKRVGKTFIYSNIPYKYMVNDVNSRLKIYHHTEFDIFEMIYHTNLPSIDISERKKWNCFRNCPMEKDTFKAIVITKFLTKFCLSKITFTQLTILMIFTQM